VSEWTNEELTKIGNATELRLASMRRDGTLRKLVTMWVVRHGDRLYVRSVKGPTGPWFRGAHSYGQGGIRAGGVEKDVNFVFIDPHDKIYDQIDTAYGDKYRRYAGPILNSVLTPAARSATIELVPR
jgi:hypothetical protein